MTVEEWRDVVGFEGLYQASSLGRIKSVQRTIAVKGHWQTSKTVCERIVSQTQNRPTGGNYVRCMVKISKNGHQYSRSVHRLVAEAFLDNPLNLPCVLHRDDNALNNCVSNLEWGTIKENVRQAAERCRMPYGEHHFAALLNDVQRRDAYDQLASGVAVIDVAARFGVSHQTICDLKHGKIKGYPMLDVPRLFARGSRSRRAKLNEEQALEIKQMLAAGVRQASIAEQFGVAKSTIAAINRGANWAWLQPTAQAS
jgi:transposase